MVTHDHLEVRPAEAIDRRWPAYAIGFSTAMLLVSARLTTPVLLGFLISWALLERRRLALVLPARDAVTITLAAFLGYALLSSLWAASALQGMLEGLMAAVIAFASLVLVKLVTLDKPAHTVRLGWGLVAGLVIGLSFFLFEELSGQAIKIWLYNSIGINTDPAEADTFHKIANGKLYWVSPSTLARNVAPISILLTPVIMALLGNRPGNRGRLYAAALFGFSCLVIFLSPHETSKVAVIGAVAIFALACYKRAWAHGAVKAAWLISCLLIVPVALLAHQLQLQNAPWLQRSAQHRILIWNFTAKQVAQAPIFGTGIYTTYMRGPEITAKAATETNKRHKEGMSRHAHNVFLQTWFELGLVGAVLLLLTGLAVLNKIASLSERLQAFALASFTSVLALMSSSYGMWQNWFLALFALTPVFFAIGARLLDGDIRSRTSS